MVEIPKRVRYITGEQHRGRDIADKFLQDVYSHLHETLDLEDGVGMHPHFEKVHRYFARPTDNAGETDDQVHYLKYKDDVVASVLETRTSFNYVQFDFFLNLENIE